MNLARKATFLTADVGCILTLASLIFVVGADDIVAEPAIATAEQAKNSLTERVSVSSAGIQANSDSVDPSLSSDGRFVVFSSAANTLVPGDATNTMDGFVHDRTTGVTELVSVDSAGMHPCCGDSGAGPISADGRFVVVTSNSDKLVPDDTNNWYDIFVHDRVTGVTERVNVDSAGMQANGQSCYYGTALSADGRFVAFGSDANNLVRDDTNYTTDVFVHDRATGVTERVSVDSAGTQANGQSFGVALSADGRFVAFLSSATNLVLSDTNNTADIFVHDRTTGVTERVSVDSAGTQANGESFGFALSADGRFVAFSSAANNLVPGDTNHVEDIFVHDRVTGVTERVNVDSAGMQANGGSYYYPTLSADGRFVSFSSAADNLVRGDTNATRDVFVHDRATRETKRVSINSAGKQANGESIGPALSADGRFVAFDSLADNLVRGDTNAVWDVFVHDLTSNSR